MSTRKVVDAKNLDTDELVYFKSHAKATYMSDGTTVEDKLANVNTDAYAGGTAVTLNGTSKAGSTASFYAPTSAGSKGQVLISNSSGSPSWRPFKYTIYNSTSPTVIKDGEDTAFNQIQQYYVTETDTVITVDLDLQYFPNPEIMFKIVNLSTSDKTLSIVPSDDYGVDTIRVINNTAMSPGKCYLVSVLNDNAIMIETGETDSRLLNKITTTQSSSDTTVTFTATAQYAVTSTILVNCYFYTQGASYQTSSALYLAPGDTTNSTTIGNVDTTKPHYIRFSSPRPDDSYIYYS